MVCDVDTEKAIANIVESNKKREQDMLSRILDSAMIFYGGKTYDKQDLLKIANEHCKINNAKFQETLKTKGKIDYDDQKMLVDCDDKLKDEILKPGDSRINETNSMGDDNIMMLLEEVKEAVYLSQLTPEQEKAELGKEAKLLPSTVELNFVLNADKSVSLSNKFKITRDGKEDSNNRISSKDILSGFYER